MAKHEALPDPSNLRYPFRQMEPGDYFDVPGRKVRSLRNSVSRMHALTDQWGFTVKVMPNGQARCMRVW